MHADMLAAVNREGALIVPVLTVAWPDGTRRYSSHPFYGPSTLTSPRTIRDLVRAWGDVEESVSDEQYQLERGAFKATVSDDDDDIQKRVARRYDLVGRVATLDLAVQGLDAAKWLTVFTGILADDPHQLEDQRAFELAFKNDDFALESFFPRHAIQRYDWPFCHADALNKWAPIIYGLHDSRTLGSDGAVPLFYVKSDSNPFRYLICHGWLRTLMVLYKDGASLGTGAYTLVRGIVNGRAYTWVEFTTNQGTAQFTADVEGLDATGDATGSLISNQADQLRHALVNYIYNEPARILSGGTPTWRPDSDAPITTASWDEGANWLDGLIYCGAKGSPYFGGDAQSTGVMAVNDLCKTVQASVQFDNLGKLAFVFEEMSQAPKSFALELDYPRDEVGRSFRPSRRNAQLFSRAIARFGKLVTRDAQLQIECEEVGEFDSTETLDLPWGPGFA